MDREISINNQIFSTYESLYDAEKKVADYIIAYPSEVIEMSIAELAAQCEASQATVMRFCKKVGCTGFYQFKIRLAGELREQREQGEQVASNEINLDQMEQSLQNIMVNKVEELKATFQNINPAEFKEMIEKILEANLIEFAAMGNTIPIALDGAYKFEQLGLQAIRFPIWESQEAFARTLKKGDMLIAISASGASRKLLDIVKIVKKKGALIVAITNQHTSALAEASDYLLLTATRENVFHNQISFTRMAAMALIDSLFLFLFYAKRDSFENLSVHEQSVAEEKI
ncbi:MAG: MurR/RpiR family transcriptional regulator [Eubacteriales bacterium]|nr:MurR/RpiR family transcriptional regulator [Eubacteriales bacterium]